MLPRRIKSIVVGERRGVKLYTANPSIPDLDSISKKKRIQIGSDTKGLVIEEDSGELVSFGGAAFFEYQKIDAEKFVKVYLAGIKQTKNLNKSGTLLFEFIYRIVQKNIESDKIIISFYEVSEMFKDLSRRRYQIGVKQLLEKEFIFATPTENIYFLNIQYLFNGNRIAFINGFEKKSK